MNENPEGTPNPLNPAPLDANPSETVSGSGKIETIKTETGAPVATNARSAGASRMAAANTTQPQPTTGLTEELIEESVFVDSLDPNGRPMEKAAPAEPKKKKKTGLIVGLIITLFIAVGCGVAAALLLMNGDKDPVSAAMNKLMSGKAPANTIIDGKIELSIKDSPVTKIDIDLDAKTKTGSAVNESSANVSLTLMNNERLSFEFDEVYSTDGSLYFKLDGVSTLIQKMGLLSLLSGTGGVDCVEDENGETTCAEIDIIDCDSEDGCDITEQLITDSEIIAQQEGLDDTLSTLLGAISIIEGEWLRISLEELNLLSGGIQTNSELSCMINLISETNTNSTGAAELYSKNPFLSSTTEGITVTNKQNPIRRVLIDDKNFANFVNSIQNSAMTSDLYSCLGVSNNVTITESDVREIMNEVPPVYVEVDSDNNFSRLYMNYTNDTAGIVIDLSFTYPSSIDISEPADYVNFSDMIQEIFSSMYTID